MAKKLTEEEKNNLIFLAEIFGMVTWYPEYVYELPEEDYQAYVNWCREQGQLPEAFKDNNLLFFRGCKVVIKQ